MSEYHQFILACIGIPVGGFVIVVFLSVMANDSMPWHRRGR
jgi:hypothetical protein